MRDFKGYSFKGQDGRVDWTVNQVKDKLFRMYAINVDTLRDFKEDYICIYTTVDGIELVDSSNMEDIVERAILKLQ